MQEGQQKTQRGVLHARAQQQLCQPVASEEETGQLGAVEEPQQQRECPPGQGMVQVGEGEEAWRARQSPAPEAEQPPAGRAIAAQLAAGLEQQADGGSVMAPPAADEQAQEQLASRQDQRLLAGQRAATQPAAADTALLAHELLMTAAQDEQLLAAGEPLAAGMRQEGAGHISSPPL